MSSSAGNKTVFDSVLRDIFATTSRSGSRRSFLGSDSDSDKLVVVSDVLQTATKSLHVAEKKTKAILEDKLAASNEIVKDTIDFQEEFERNVQRLDEDVKEVDDSIHDPQSGFKARIANAVTEYQSTKDQLSRTKTAIRVLKKIREIVAGCDQLRQLTDDRDYYGAAELVMALKEEIAIVKTEELKDEHQPCQTFIQLEKGVEEQEETLKDLLLQTACSAFLFSDSEMEIRVPILNSNTHSFLKVLQTLQILNKSSEFMEFLSENLDEFLIRPLLEDRLARHQQDDTNRVVFHFVDRSGGSGSGDDARYIEPLGALFSFVFTKIFSEDPSLMPELGVVMWEHISQALIDEDLSKRMPKHIHSLQRFKDSTVAQTSQFETDLISFGFIKENMVKLSSYSSKLDTKFWKMRRRDILLNARRVITDYEFKIWLPNGAEDEKDEAESQHEYVRHSRDRLKQIQEEFSESFFGASPCQISVDIVKLVRLFHTTLEEACESHGVPECAYQLYLVARDIVYLFLAIFPSLHEDHLSVPQLSMLFYNDAIYFSHHITCASSHLKNRLTLATGGDILLADLVTQVQSLGQSYFVDQLNQQRDITVEHLSGINGFSVIEHDGTREEIQNCINRALHNLSHLLKIWREVLPNAALFRLVGGLMNVITSEILNTVLLRVSREFGDTDNRDIAVEAGIRIHAVLCNVIRCPDLIHDMPYICKYTQTWKKFNTLTDILHPDQSLLNLQKLYRKGRLKKFSVSELRDLVEALFESSPKREACIRVLSEKSELNT